MRRIADAVVLTLIGLSAVALLVLLGQALWALRHGPVPGALQDYATRSVLIYPGWALALLKLVAHAGRGLRERTLPRPALFFLAFAVAPFAAQALVERLAAASPGVAAEPVAVAVRNVPAIDNPFAEGQPALDTPGYAAGRQWARTHRFVGPRDCQGEEDFVRGCLNYYKLNVVGGENAGLTTAECQRIVNHDYDRRYERDNPGRRGGKWMQEFQHCAQIDQNLAQAYVIPAYESLRALLDRLEAGGSVTPQEQAAVAHDVAQMPSFIDIPYKDAFLELHDDFQRRLAGSSGPPLASYPQLSCEEYRERLDELQRREQAYVAELQTLRRPDGVVGDGRRHSELNQLRIELYAAAAPYAKGYIRSRCAAPADASPIH